MGIKSNPHVELFDAPEEVQEMLRGNDHFCEYRYLYPNNDYDKETGQYLYGEEKRMRPLRDWLISQGWDGKSEPVYFD